MTTRMWIWLACAAAAGIGLCFVPLFGVLGYELALATAGFASIAGLDIGASRARATQRAAVGPRRGLVPEVIASCGVTATVALVPAIIAAVHGIWAPTCDWSFGILAFAAMPMASAVLAGALGHALATAIGTRTTAGPWWLPHRSTWLAVGLPMALLVIAGTWQFYSEPPVFIYNPIIGYFPGNLYDEDIALAMPLVWSRLEALAVVVAIVAAIGGHVDAKTQRIRWKLEPRRRVLPWYAASATAALTAIVLRANAGQLGYAIDATDIQAELGTTLNTEHFTIFYENTPEIAADIQLIARDHELRYAQVVAQIEAAPPGKLTSYYFATPEQKSRWLGAKHVEMAKPWRREIYLDHRPFPHPSLRHEIAHAVASAFGDPLFGVATRRIVLANPGLIEGLAVALDWPGGYDRLSPHEAVRAMQRLGMQPQIADLFSIQFFAVAPARGYTTAGSFLRFLLDRYGPRPLRQLYESGGDFATSYQRSLRELESEWRAMISAIEISDEAVESVRERFRTASVFARPCPHAVAAKRNAARAAQAAGDRARAVALMRGVCTDAPDEPGHLLELGDVLASDADRPPHLGNPDSPSSPGGQPTIESLRERKGIDAHNAAFVAQNIGEARTLWGTVADNRNYSAALRAEALRRLARLTTDVPAQLALIDRARALPLDAADRRIFDAQAFALRATGPAGPLLRQYFQYITAGPELEQIAAEAVVREPALGLARYLLGLQKANASKWPEAAAQLDQALASGLPGDHFARFAARRLAVAAYRAGDTARLERAIAALDGPQRLDHRLHSSDGSALPAEIPREGARGESGVVDRLLADDWRQRRAFDVSGTLPRATLHSGQE